MRESYVQAEIEFLPTSVDEKAMFGDKLKFLPTSAEEKSLFWAENEILPTSVNEKQLYFELKWHFYLLPPSWF